MVISFIRFPLLKRFSPSSSLQSPWKSNSESPLIVLRTNAFDCSITWALKPSHWVLIRFTCLTFIHCHKLRLPTATLDPITSCIFICWNSANKFALLLLFNKFLPLFLQFLRLGWWVFIVLYFINSFLYTCIL